MAAFAARGPAAAIRKFIILVFLDLSNSVDVATVCDGKQTEFGRQIRKLGGSGSGPKERPQRRVASGSTNLMGPIATKKSFTSTGSTKTKGAHPIATMHCIVIFSHGDLPGTGTFAVSMQSVPVIDACIDDESIGVGTIAIAPD